MNIKIREKSKRKRNEKKEGQWVKEKHKQQALKHILFSSSLF